MTVDNPFQRRATEQVKSDEAFLAIVTPEPVSMYLSSYGSSGQLYDRLVIILGTPGSGKTTIARLFEFPVIRALIEGRESSAHRAVKAALHDCHAMRDNKPTILGARVPLESDYREIWELPYNEDVRQGLFQALVQARAVLTWLRNVEKTGISLDEVRVLLREEAAGGVGTIGGSDPRSIRQKAVEVEKEVYKAVGALVAPKLEEIGSHALQAYRPFQVIEEFEVRFNQENSYRLQPAVFLDDAHTLHPRQFKLARQWLLRREIPVARWLISRLDILAPQEVLALDNDPKDAELPGITKTRDVVEISFQGYATRRDSRRAFRKMAKDMADRYLRQMSIFRNHHIEDFAGLLSEQVEQLSVAKRKELESLLSTDQRRLHISQSRLNSLAHEIESFQPEGRPLFPDEAIAMLSILLHRYVKRVPQSPLFAGEDPEPARKVTADSSILHAARLKLMHEFDRPFYFGIDDICDASSENAEQFLRLAGILVDASATRLVRRQSEVLSARTQHELLRSRAAEFISNWDFPQAPFVVGLIHRIAQRCLRVSLEPNAWIGPGANAYGIPQTEFNALAEANQDLARTLKYAVAYNAIVLVTEYPCKDKLWALFELGGLPILRYGLTLRRGGFIEGDLSELATYNKELDEQ